MREASVSCFLSVGCRVGPRGLDVRGEIGELGSDGFVQFLICNERDWFCFEIVLTELRGFRRIDRFFDSQLFFYDRGDCDRFYHGKSSP